MVVASYLWSLDRREDVIRQVLGFLSALPDISEVCLVLAKAYDEFGLDPKVAPFRSPFRLIEFDNDTS
jgi:hypothetical protein